MKVCPECKYQFADEHEFCPSHGKRLTLATVFVNAAPLGPGAATIFFNPNQQPQENYEKLIGTVLDGRYILEEKKGEGGMGVVFKARHTVIEKTVAVKILKRDVARDRAVLQRFVQEAKAASRIGHWGIVDVTDFGTLPDGSAYQVMEYIDGVTIAKAMKTGPMWAARAMPIVAQICRALGAAHDKGIVHRDLKPENVFLLERNGHADLVKIVDFGVAKFAPMGSVDGPRLTRAGAVFGTPEYMAPEQAAGRSDNDQRVDIYALGTILYEMLVGRVPHKGDTVVATLAQQMLDPIIPPRRMNPRADVSDRLDQVIMTALNKDRDRRYATMADMLAGLEWAASELGVALDGGSPSGSLDLPMMQPTPKGMSPFDRTPSGSHGVRPGLGGPTVPDVRDSAVHEAEMAAAEGRATGRRFTFAAVGIVAIAAVTLGVAFAVRRNKGVSIGGDGGSGGVAMGGDAGAPIASAHEDAAPIARAGADARPVAAASSDAGRDLALAGGDAGVVATMHENPPGPGPDNLPPDDPGLKGVLSTQILVITEPSGGSLYIAGLAAGTDGTTFKRSKGTKLEISCLFPGNAHWEPGHADLTFDGRAGKATCKMLYKTRCVKDLHNPFRTCPD